jgi:OFA family oxalate/formate antiporter-like MFS transporter
MLFAAMTFLCWGEIFSIFPATCADTFGSKYAAANAGTLYTAKGTASMMVPLASVLASLGSWNTVFIATAITSIAAGICAKFVLAPMRRRWIENTLAEASPQPVIGMAFQPDWTEAPSKSSTR